MKVYKDYMDNISISPELHDKIMQKAYRQQKPINKNRIVLRYAGMAACLLVLLLCVWPILSLFNSPTSDHPGTNGEQPGVNALTLNRNGSVDPSILDNPVIPELRDEQVSISEARSDPDFGEYLPISVPVPFQFDNARRFINQETNSLMTFWGADRAESIRWFVSMPTQHDIAHIVSVHEHEKYDLSLYSIPWAFSVPDEFHYYFQSPVFLAEELTIDVIRARTIWESSRSGATPGWQTSQFSVLYDNVLITVSMNGVSPEQIWNMITEIERR